MYFNIQLDQLYHLQLLGQQFGNTLKSYTVGNSGREYMYILWRIDSLGANHQL